MATILVRSSRSVLAPGRFAVPFRDASRAMRHTYNHRLSVAPSRKAYLNTESQCKKKSQPTHDPGSLTKWTFWESKPIWRRASVNTLRCLVGCTAGDFSSMWYLQTSHADLGMGLIMAISMASGIMTSLALETVLLRKGRDNMPWSAAVKTAAGMSMISMVTMETAENLVDYYLTGGQVAIDSPAFWAAGAVAMVAGFLAPLPYNYIRLRKYGKACH